MAYTKNTWQTGDTITAEKLNHMETGIYNSINRISVTVFIDNDNMILKMTGPAFDDIYSVLTNGGLVNAYSSSIQQGTGQYQKALVTFGVVASVNAVSFGSLLVMANGTADMDGASFTWTYDADTMTYTFTYAG